MSDDDQAITAKSLLAIDLGTMYSRAILFDVVDGRYQFIATGYSTTTADAPISNAPEGILRAVKMLQELCGRRILDERRTILSPAEPDGSGVDQVVMIHSAGPRLRIALAGLLDDFSLESATRLVNSLPAQVVERTGLGDLRPRAVQLDAVLAARPDLMIVAGGTEGGASRSVYEQVELAGLVCQVLRESRKPVVLYCGNQALVENVEEFLGRLTRIRIAPNLRPSLTEENYAPALDVYSRIFSEIRMDQYSSLRGMIERCGANPVPAAYGFGRIIRFLSQIYDQARGVMGLDLGSSCLTAAYARAGDLSLMSFPAGMGSGMPQLLRESRLADFARWMPFDISDSDLQDRLYQMSLFPQRIPSTAEGLAISQAAARQALRLGMKKLAQGKPRGWLNFEPFLISGSTLTQTPDPMDALLVLLDGIQPTGLTTFVLDQNNLLAGLGAAAEVNPVLPVQVLESGAFLNLGTVICPIFTRSGNDLLRVRLEYNDDTSLTLEARHGGLLKLPVRSGQDARVHLEGGRGTIIDPASGSHAGSYQVKGGACGVVLDMRGRPLRIPPDKKKRQALLHKWNEELGL